jgi:hypothetical protein
MAQAISAQNTMFMPMISKSPKKKEDMTRHNLLATHASQLLQNQHLRIHPPVNTVRGAGLLAAVQGSECKGLAGHALLEAGLVEGVDGCNTGR